MSERRHPTPEDVRAAIRRKHKMAKLKRGTKPGEPCRICYKPLMKSCKCITTEEA